MNSRSPSLVFGTFAGLGPLIAIVVFTLANDIYGLSQGKTFGSLSEHQGAFGIFVFYGYALFILPMSIIGIYVALSSRRNGPVPIGQSVLAAFLLSGLLYGILWFFVSVNHPRQPPAGILAASGYTVMAVVALILIATAICSLLSRRWQAPRP